MIYNLGIPKFKVDKMENQNISLLNLENHQKAKISNIEGGHYFKKRLDCMGIRMGRDIRIISKQPFKGPLTIEVCGFMITIGRGMAQKIFVEVI
jgi:Fe2+ transport system protein FeoA